MDKKANELQDNKEGLLSEVESYAKAEYELARLRIVDYAGRIVSVFLLAICILFIVFAVLALCAAAAVSVLAQFMHTWAACLIVGGAYLLLIPLLVIGSKWFFVNPVVRKLSGIKNVEELKYATIRAEGRVAVHRERITHHVKIAQMVFDRVVGLMGSLWDTIIGIFKKIIKI